MIRVYICQIWKCWNWFSSFTERAENVQVLIDWNSVQELQAHILVFETEPGFNSIWFFSSFKRISNISRERKKNLYMGLKIEIYSGSKYENWTHIFVDIYNEEWFERKNKLQFENSLFTRFNSSSIPICRFQSIKESLIIMLQLYIHVTDLKTVYRSSNIKTPPTFAAPDYIKLYILCNDK